MRTTVDLDPDTAHAVDELRREQGQGLSDAANELIRRGLLSRDPQRRFSPRTHELGIRSDLPNIAETLDVLEGPGHR